MIAPSGQDIAAARVAAFVERTAAASGVPVTPTNPAALAAVASVLADTRTQGGAA